MSKNDRRKGSATGDADADAFLRENGNAVLVGILLDQQVRAEMAFSGPYKIKQRLGHFDMKQIAEMDEEDLAAVFQEKPAVHRFYNMMAGRVRDLAAALSDKYDGNGAELWRNGTDTETIQERASELPGFGSAKASALPEALDLFGHRQFEE